MTERWDFDDKRAFLAKIEELLRQGVPAERIRVLTPLPVHEVDALLRVKPSPLRFFTLAGALTGMALGFVFPILTVRHWPLITGGKPLISIPPFVVIAFALTILLGAIASLLGFLHLTRLPSVASIRDPQEHANGFAILVAGESPTKAGSPEPRTARRSGRSDD